jgi:hypothetical protein
VVNVVVVILSTITVKDLTEGMFSWLLLYFLPLFLWFDRGLVHVVVVTLSTTTVYGFTEECFMLLLLCLPLVFKV